MRNIAVSEPLLVGREREYVLDCLDTKQLSSVGRYVTRFETKLAEFCFPEIPAGKALACSSGTTALHLAMLALGVGPGDHVIVPALSYVATANAVSYCGATPIFCDVDPDTWCIDIRSAEGLLHDARIGRRRVVGIIPVHLYGVPANMSAVNDFALTHRLWTVEDAAEAHGAVYRGAPVGSISSIGVFSFYGNKIITCGEGGAVTTAHEELVTRMKLFRGQGMDPKRRYWHPIIGYNYRLTNVQAAIALGQLETISIQINARNEVFKQYNYNLPSRLWRQAVPDDCVSANWMFTVVLPTGIKRDCVIEMLSQRGIETRPTFVPLTELPPYHQNHTPPVAADLGTRGLSLPTHACLSKADIQYICANLMEVIGD